jgi:hypothetical protein
MITNRSIVNLFPTNNFLQWLKYIRESEYKISLSELEPISFMIEDFDSKEEFIDWLKRNFQILFEIRLNYSCIDNTLWPENRTFEVFTEWFEIRFTNLILDLKNNPLEIANQNSSNL